MASRNFSHLEPQKCFPANPKKSTIRKIFVPSALFSRHLLTVQEKFKICHILRCYSKTIRQNQLHWLPRRTLSSIGNIEELIIVEQAGQINNRRWVLLFSLLFNCGCRNQNPRVNKVWSMLKNVFVAFPKRNGIAFAAPRKKWLWIMKLSDRAYLNFFHNKLR